MPEVKGWYPNHIVGGDNHDIEVNQQGQSARLKHPVRQARDYMCNLMDRCRKHRLLRDLVNDDGPHAGRFVFPFGFMAVLSNICLRFDPNR